MAHLTLGELLLILAPAKSAVPLGSVWTHYKDPGKRYTVRGYSLREDTDEPAILYHPEYDNFPKDFIWDRVFSEWIGEVGYPDGTTGPRFKRIDKN